MTLGEKELLLELPKSVGGYPRRTRFATPATPATEPNVGNALFRLWLMAALILLLPNMVGTQFESQYAYVLAVVAAIFGAPWNGLRSAGELAAYWVLAAGSGLCLLYSTSLVTTTALVISQDYVVLLREIFPFALLAFALLQTSRLSLEQRDVFQRRQAYLFLAMAVGLLAAQAVSPAVHEFLFRYYNTHADLSWMQRCSAVRPGLTFGNPNVLAFATIVFTLPALTSRSISRGSFAVCAIAATIVIVFTLSRTGLITWVVCLAITAVLRKRTTTLVLSAVCGLALATTFALEHSAADPVLERLEHRYLGKATSMTARLELWDELMTGDAFRENWVFGVGPANAWLRVCDNWYLLVLYRYGLIGLIFTMAFLLQLARIAVRMLKDPQWRDQGVLALAFLLAFAVSGMAMAPTSAPRLAAVFWVSLGTALAPVNRRSERDSLSSDRTLAVVTTPRKHRRGLRPAVSK